MENIVILTLLISGLWVAMMHGFNQRLAETNKRYKRYIEFYVDENIKLHKKVKGLKNGKRINR